MCCWLHLLMWNYNNFNKKNSSVKSIKSSGALLNDYVSSVLLYLACRTHISSTSSLFVCLKLDRIEIKKKNVIMTMTDPVSEITQKCDPRASIVLLWTKQAVKLATHQKLISVPVIDQLNSRYPHDFRIVFPALNPLDYAPDSHSSQHTYTV